MDEREREVKRHNKEEAGQKGGSLEAQMASGAYPVARPLAVPLGWVNWNAIAAGSAIALATTILLNALGVAIGLALTRAGFGGSLAYWMIGATVVGNPAATVMTSSSFFIRSSPNLLEVRAMKARRLADEPELTSDTYFTPRYFEKSCSNRSAYRPMVSQKSRDASIRFVISASSKTLPP
jgi:hypothetical protein